MNGSIFLRASLVVSQVSPPPITHVWNDEVVGCLMSEVMAQTYYIKPNGNDANDGLTEQTAWASLARVQAANAQFNSGDEILFESGGTYRGKLELTGRNGIRISTYPEAAPPAVLKGSIAVPNTLWTVEDGIYVADLSAIPGMITAPSFIGQVYENEQIMRIARFPNWDPQDPESSFLRNDPQGVGATIVDSELPGAPGYWLGAWVVLRSANYQYQMSEVESHSQVGTLVLRNDYSGDGLLGLGGNDWGYYLVNKLEELDAPGEWYYDAMAGLLYAQSLNVGQAPQEVEVVVEMDGLFLNNSDQFTIDNVEFAHYADAAIEPFTPIDMAQSLTIMGCVFRDVLIGIRDLYSLGLVGRTVDNCTFERCLLYGIRGTWSAGEVSNCTLRDIGLHSGFNGLLNTGATSNEVRGNEYGAYSALYVQGSGIRITDNVIYTAGNNGINFSGDNALAENNFVTGALSLVNDGAAITFDNCDGCDILSNIVSNSVGIQWGQSTLTGNNEEKTTGIYFGNGDITNTTVQGNVVSECSDGILIDHAPGFDGNRVLNNTAFGCDEAQIILQDLGIHENPDPSQNDTYFPIFDTEISQNVLYCLNSGQLCLFESQAKALSYAGTQPLVVYVTYDANKYFNPFSEVLVGQQVFYDDGLNGALGGTKLIPWTLEAWRSRYQQDATTTISPLSLRDFRISEYLSAPFSNLSTDCESPDSGDDWYDGCGPVQRIFDDGSYVNRIDDCAFAERNCCYQDAVNTRAYLKNT